MQKGIFGEEQQKKKVAFPFDLAFSPRGGGKKKKNTKNRLPLGKCTLKQQVLQKAQPISRRRYVLIRPLNKKKNLPKA